MKTIIFIILLLSTKLASQEIPIWEFYSYQINSFDFLNDEEIIVHTNNNDGTSYILEISTGNILDSIVHGLNWINDFDKNENLISMASFNRTIVVDLNSKEVIANLGDISIKDIGFKNLNELYVIQDFGLVSFNINDGKIDTIWNNLPNDSKYNIPVLLRNESCFSFDNKNAILYWGGTQGVYCYNIDCKTGDFLYSIAGKEPISNPVKDEYFVENVNYITFYNVNSKVYTKKIDLSEYGSLDGAGEFSYSTDGNYITRRLNGEVYYFNNNNELSINNKFSIWGRNNVPHQNFIIAQNNKFVSVYDINSLNVQDKIQSTSIYPNPTSVFINIDTENNVNIELFDIFGNKLLEDFNTKLDISNLSPGTYYIRYLEQTRMVVKI